MHITVDICWLYSSYLLGRSPKQKPRMGNPAMVLYASRIRNGETIHWSICVFNILVCLSGFTSTENSTETEISIVTFEQHWDRLGTMGSSTCSRRFLIFFATHTLAAETTRAWLTSEVLNGVGPGWTSGLRPKAKLRKRRLQSQRLKEQPEAQGAVSHGKRWEKCAGNNF